MSLVSAQHASLSVGAILVVMTAVSIPLMDRAGRKLLQLTGLGGMMLSGVLFTITYHLAIQVNAGVRCYKASVEGKL